MYHQTSFLKDFNHRTFAPPSVSIRKETGRQQRRLLFLHAKFLHEDWNLQFTIKSASGVYLNLYHKPEPHTMLVWSFYFIFYLGFQIGLPFLYFFVCWKKDTIVMKIVAFIPLLHINRSDLWDLACQHIVFRNVLVCIGTTLFPDLFTFYLFYESVSMCG